MIPSANRPSERHIESGVLCLGLLILHSRGYLDLESTRKIRRLNRQWSQAGNALIDKMSVVDQIASQTLGKFRELNTFMVKGNSLSALWNQAHFAQLKTLKNLVELHFENSHCISDDNLEPLQFLTGLKKLSFIDCPDIKGHGFHHITALQKLKALRMTGINPEILIQSGGHEAIKSLTNLTRLSFGPLNSRQVNALVENRCLNLTDVTFENKRLETFQKRVNQTSRELLSTLEAALNNYQLALERRDAIEGEFKDLFEGDGLSTLVSGQKALLSLPLLANLDISALEIDEKGYDLIGQLTGLTHLKIAHTGPFLTPKPLSRLTELKSLIIEKVISHLDVANLSTTLSYLKFNFHTFEITDPIAFIQNPAGRYQTFISSLAQLQNLEVLKLELYRTRYGPDFQIFAGMAKLKELHYGFQDVETAVEMKAIASHKVQIPFSKLQDLALLKVKATADLLKFIKTLLNLRGLDLINCESDSGGVDHLKSARPDLIIATKSAI